MFLAGKGTSTNPKPQIEGAGESFAVKPPVAAPQSGSGPSCTDELTASKPTGISALPITKVDPSKPGNVIRPISAATMMTSGETSFLLKVLYSSAFLELKFHF